MLHYEDQTLTSRSWEFRSFLDGTGTGTGKIWSQKKYRNQKIFVPEKSTGIGTRKIWYGHTLTSAPFMFILSESC